MTRETLREAVARALRRAFFDHHFNRASDAGWEDELATADAALTAIEASGWRIVPVEPTPIRALEWQSGYDAGFEAAHELLSAAPPSTETEKE